MAHRARKRSDEGGNGVRGLAETASPGVRDDAREVVGFAHKRGKGRTHQRRGGLIHDRDQPRPDDLECDGIELCGLFKHVSSSSGRGQAAMSTTMLPEISQWKDPLGPTSNVDSGSSTTAGPETV